MSTMLNLPAWKVRGFPVTGGTSMSNEFVRRGGQGVYYANVTYRGIRLRDCLKTVDRNEAQRRIIELKLLVGRVITKRQNKRLMILRKSINPVVSVRL